MTIAIRELGLADKILVEELLDAISPGWTDALAPGGSGAVAFLSQPRSFAFGAYVHNEPAGWLWGSQLLHPDGLRTSHLQRVAVIDEHQRKGIATALVEAAIGLARRQGSNEVVMEIDLNHKAAAAIANRFSATPDGAAVTLHQLRL